MPVSPLSCAYRSSCETDALDDRETERICRCLYSCGIFENVTDDAPPDPTRIVEINSMSEAANDVFVVSRLSRIAPLENRVTVIRKSRKARRCCRKRNLQNCNRKEQLKKSLESKPTMRHSKTEMQSWHCFQKPNQ